MSAKKLLTHPAHHSKGHLPLLLLSEIANLQSPLLAGRLRRFRFRLHRLHLLIGPSHTHPWVESTTMTILLPSFRICSTYFQETVIEISANRCRFCPSPDTQMIPKRFIPIGKIFPWCGWWLVMDIILCMRPEVDFEYQQSPTTTPSTVAVVHPGVVLLQSGLASASPARVRQVSRWGNDDIFCRVLSNASVRSCSRWNASQIDGLRLLKGIMFGGGPKLPYCATYV